MAMNTSPQLKDATTGKKTEWTAHNSAADVYTVDKAAIQYPWAGTGTTNAPDIATNDMPCSAA